MRSQKAQKIDLNAEYPCPCRRKGRIIPITLTEAFGCDRCQQIFVLGNNGWTIEQLSSTYSYKRIWRWTGHRWNVANSSLGESYLPLTLGIIIVLLIVWLPLALRSPSSVSIIFWAIIAILVAVIPALMAWLVYRR